ncbi:MAG: phytanoyl-CoA dioxygenase family protein [Planctomycetota bacterium]|nr:phytanoyl-CoA dioxygenase family protein [Planctomycetota bacterium]
MLNEYETAFFRDQGYLNLGRVLDDARLAELRALADAELAKAQSDARGSWDLLEAPAAGRAAVFRLSRVMARHPAFQAVAQDERVAEAVRAAVSPDAVVCVNRHNMMVVKAPRVGRQIDWHQDGVNWGHARMVSFMVFLDDAGVENGCLEVIPGAHKLGLLRTVKTAVGEGMDVHDPLQAALIRQAVPLCARAGEGLLFHSALPHFSKANASERYRRNLTFAYVSDADRALPSGMAPIEALPLEAAEARAG